MLHLWLALLCVPLAGLAVVLQLRALLNHDHAGLMASDSLQPLDWSRAGVARRATAAQRLARSGGLAGVC